MTAPHDGDATLVAQAPTENAPGLAWALEDDSNQDYEMPRMPWPIACGVAGGVVVVSALLASAIAAIGLTLHREPVDAPTVAAPPTSTVVIQAPPPSAVQAPPVTPVTPVAPVTPAPTAAAPPETPPPTHATRTPEIVNPDQKFLDRMRAAGWTITDPTRMLSVAHKVCREFRQGETGAQVDQELEAEGNLEPTAAVTFSSNATESYPNC